MSKQPKKRLPNTLGEVAEKYGIGLVTLNSMIDLHPELKKMVEPYKTGNKKIYPPTIIDTIYKTFRANA